MVLSAYQPTAVLAGGKIPANGSGRLRQLLVIVQFAILIGPGRGDRNYLSADDLRTAAGPAL